ncbi:hypothetical protein AKJ66_00035 [candidate division MSBL1 archaeon SCGC-AAA259E22]|uniref:Uncharacterized protein n=1 Tax=candidate division MSBL1 archaeon SCGC-AAA259E22 TaxID=1698265 RepID=A0A133UIF7_9EURY|nr:hypothetical protein AKJ66_00035 [candidate division MSBL1 archaeon SCGC-AAA259E22]
MGFLGKFSSLWCFLPSSPWRDQNENGGQGVGLRSISQTENSKGRVLGKFSERHTEDPRTDSGRIVVRCPVCELEFISTAFGLSDEAVEKLKGVWIRKGASVEVAT